MGELGVQVKAVKGLRRSMTAWENRKKLGMLSRALALQITSQETLVFGQGLTEHEHQKVKDFTISTSEYCWSTRKSWKSYHGNLARNSSCRFSVSWPRDIEVRLEGVFFQGFVPHMLLCHLLRIRTSTPLDMVHVILFWQTERQTVRNNQSPQSLTEKKQQKKDS